MKIALGVNLNFIFSYSLLKKVFRTLQTPDLSDILIMGTKTQVGILGLGPYLVMCIRPRRSK